MSARSTALTVVVTAAVTAGIFWLLANRAGTPANSDATEIPDEATVVRLPPPPIPAEPLAVESVSTAKPPDESPPVAPAAAPRPWPQAVRSFIDEVDPDPTLSRELERTVQSFLDSRLSRDTYEVESVTCRGSTCQILSVGDSESGGPTWSEVFAPILRDMSAASTQNPNTGAELEPKLQSVFMVPKSGSVRGFATRIAFN